MEPQRISLPSVIIRTVTITLLALASGCSHEQLTAKPSTATPTAALPLPQQLEPAQDKTATAIVSPEVALASHLQQSGAIMYGAYWCPYCKRQKQMFGPKAFSHIKYIECDAKGQNGRPDLCIKAKIVSYPSWEINGQIYRGMLSLEELADLSSYQGERDFSSRRLML